MQTFHNGNTNSAGTVTLAIAAPVPVVVNLMFRMSFGTYINTINDIHV